MRWIALCLALLAVPAWAQQIKTYYWVATAYNSAGLESAPSNEASKAVSVSDPTGTLTWSLPTMNTDGTPLTDLAGIRLYRSETSGGCAALVSATCQRITDTQSATVTSYIDSPPLPSVPAAPMNLAVQTDTTAYRMRQSVDGLAFVAIGSIEPGTQCDGSHSIDGYSIVPRAAVKLASRFDTLPLIVLARCG